MHLRAACGTGGDAAVRRGVPADGIPGHTDQHPGDPGTVGAGDVDGAGRKKCHRSDDADEESEVAP